MKSKLSSKRTLGPVSAALIGELLERGKSIFTLDEAAEIYGHNKAETANFLMSLVKREVLTRLKGGRYIILQKGQENMQLSNWPVIARELALPGDYYISHYSAMRLHGMTTHPLLSTTISMMKRRAVKTVKDITYRFVYVKPTYFWGYETHWVTQEEKVYVSDLERTILDGLERPELCGGIKDVVRGIWFRQKDIDWDRMVNYAKKFRTKAAVKRLGFILQMFELREDIQRLLHEHILSAKDYVLLDPCGEKCGRHIRRWYLQINMDVEELKEGVWG